MSIQSKRNLISFLFYGLIFFIGIGGVILGQATNTQHLIYGSLGILIGFVLFYKITPISRWLEQLMIRQVGCYSCGKKIELIGRWRCGCSFVTYQERHVFSPCPLCGKVFSFLVCQQCETGIPL